jgi:hypothetical protein
VTTRNASVKRTILERGAIGIDVVVDGGVVAASSAAASTSKAAKTLGADTKCTVRATTRPQPKRTLIEMRIARHGQGERRR